jgi:hypothetical protein
VSPGRFFLPLEKAANHTSEQARNREKATAFLVTEFTFAPSRFFTVPVPDQLKNREEFVLSYRRPGGQNKDATSPHLRGCLCASIHEPL